MSTKMNVRYILEAIDAVRAQAQLAKTEGNLTRYSSLIADLSALERSLVGETTKLIYGKAKKKAA